MVVFHNNLQRLWNNKMQLVFVLLFPIAFMFMGTVQTNPGIKVVLLDKDQTALTQWMVKDIQSKFNVIPIADKDVEQALMDYKIDYAVTLPAGFSDALLTSNAMQAEAISIQESNRSLPVRTYITDLIQQLDRLGKAAGGDSSEFQASLDDLQQASLQIEQHASASHGLHTSHTVLGMMAVALLYTSFTFSFTMISNRDRGTMQRTLAAPIRIKSYMLQHMGSSLLVCLVQIGLFLLVMKGFGIYLGASWLSIYSLFAVFSLVCVSFSIFLSSISKNVVQVGIFGLLIIQPMSLIGSAYFPRDFIPEMLQKIARFVPLSWLMDGVDHLLLGDSLTQLVPQMAMLVLFACIFFLIGALKKTNLPA